MVITVTAPNRVDLAGGTTDIYPLYLFMGGGCTVNVAVDILSRVRVETREGDGLRITSEDLAHTIEVAGPDELQVDGPLGLIGRAVKFLAPSQALQINTRNDAPAGSGLGASSALLCALLAALMKLKHQEHTRDELIELAENVEAAAIEVPTGKQDHIAAVYGGLSIIHFGYGGYERTTLREESCVERLEEMLVLSYTGQGRFSGMNNWEVTKKFIDKDRGVRDKLIQIRDISRELAHALAEKSWRDLPDLVQREWNARKSLAPGITTPRIEAMMDVARSAGALANKVCGAGGGGCMVTLVSPDSRPKVVEALSAFGARVMDVHVAREGLTLY